MSVTKKTKINFTILTIVFIFSGICNYSNAQDGEKLSADEYFKYEDYNRALIEYLALYRADKEDIKLNTRVGYCYLKVNGDKTKATPFLEFVYKKGKYEDEILLYLGMAYMYAYKLDDAIKFFNAYRAKIKSKSYDMVDRLIKNCENAKELMKKPVNVTFENLGKVINTKYPEYYPFVTQDQTTLFFTSSRERNAKKIQSTEGFFTSDIYVSKDKLGEWTKPKSLSPTVNTDEDEECVYVTPKGKTMIIYLDNQTTKGDLFITSLGKAKTFPKPETFEDPVNTPDSDELEGCITEDGSMLIVSSDRAGGLGATDLYKFTKLPNGHWSQPVNLGPNVNTPYEESFPVYDEKNQILYFSSKGHANMGGYDIFKSKYHKETESFGQAVNIGYPINTPEDNIGFSLSANKRDGYIAAVRKEGLGDLDLYKVVFNDVDQSLSIIRGKISTSDSLKKVIDAYITVTDVSTQEIVDSKNANPANGEFKFAIGAGKYLLTAVSPGYIDFKEEIIVYDKTEKSFEIEKNIVLQKVGVPSPVVKGKGAKTPVKKK